MPKVERFNVNLDISIVQDDYKLAYNTRPRTISKQDIIDLLLKLKSSVDMVPPGPIRLLGTSHPIMSNEGKTYVYGTMSVIVNSIEEVNEI